MKFDWYTASIDQKPDHVIDGLLSKLPYASVEDARPRYGFRNAHTVKSGFVEHCSVMYGGKAVGDAVMVDSSGRDAHEVAGHVRELFPGHRVTRADVAEDYRDPEAFDKLQALGKSIADEFRLKVNMAGDWYRGEEGRTLYVGSPKSDVFVRIYEKGIQLDCDPTWVRVEAQVRPNGNSRVLAGMIKPSEFFGFRHWLSQFGSRLGVPDIQRIKAGTEWRPPDHDRAYKAMLSQYARTLKRVREELGSWDCVGLQIGQDLEELEKADKPVR